MCCFFRGYLNEGNLWLYFSLNRVKLIHIYKKRTFVSKWSLKRGIRSFFQSLPLVLLLIASVHEKRKPKWKKQQSTWNFCFLQRITYLSLEISKKSLSKNWIFTVHSQQTSSSYNSTHFQIPQNHTDYRLCIPDLPTMRSHAVIGSWRNGTPL